MVNRLPKEPEFTGEIELSKLTRRVNPRQHGQRNISQIVRSLERFGAARSIVIDESGGIICGKGLVEAAEKAGLKKVRTVECSGDEIIAVVRRGLSEQDKKALDVADNRSSELAEWDAEVLEEFAQEISLEDFFTADELEALLRDPSEPTGAESSPADQPNETPQSMTVPLYITLTRKQFQKWERRKQDLETETDTEAFLKIAKL